MSTPTDVKAKLQKSMIRVSLGKNKGSDMLTTMEAFVVHGEKKPPILGKDGKPLPKPKSKKKKVIGEIIAPVQKEKQNGIIQFNAVGTRHVVPEPVPESKVSQNCQGEFVLQ
jgi:hypothetical protein